MADRGTPEAYETTETPAHLILADNLQQISDELAETSPWVRFLGVLALISAILTTVISGVALIAGLTDPKDGGAGFVIAGVVCAGVAVLWVYPSRTLLAYARSISSFRQTGQLPELLAAVNEQRKFWRFATTAIVALAIAGAVVAVVTPRG